MPFEKNNTKRELIYMALSLSNLEEALINITISKIYSGRTKPFASEIITIVVN